MANQTLTDLTELTAVQDGDFLYIVDVSDTTDSPEGTGKKITKFNLNLDNVDFLGSIVPTSTPTGTGKAYWLATQVGTYTNFGGVVVSANSLAVISRDSAGVFSISQTAFDFSAYLDSEVLDLKVSNYLKSIPVPEDKTSQVYSLFVDNVNYYGQKTCFFNPSISSFKSFKMKANNLGTIQIAFISITANNATIIHTITKNVNSTGVISFAANELSLPDFSAYSNVYVVVGNENNTVRTALYKTITTQTDGFALAKTGGVIIENTTSKRTSCNFWIEYNTSKDWLLINKVKGIDNYAALVEAINSGEKDIKLAPTEIIIEGTLYPKKGQNIYGNPNETILQASSTTNIIFDIIEEGVKISDMTLKGNFADVDIFSPSIIAANLDAETNTGMGLGYGIYVHTVNANGCVFENLRFKNFSADGFWAKEVGFSGGDVFTEGVKMNNVWFEDCYRGFRLANSEYSTFSNITVRDCLIGCTVAGGNNVIVNSLFTHNRIGVHYTAVSSTNNAHGLISNVSANHCELSGLYMKGINLGQYINSFTIFFGSAEIDSCQGVFWNGGQIGASADIIHKNPTGINVFSNIMFTSNASTISNTGIPPVMKNNFYANGDDNSVINN